MWRIIPTNLPSSGEQAEAAATTVYSVRRRAAGCPTAMPAERAEASTTASRACSAEASDTPRVLFLRAPRVLFLRACPVEDGTFTVSDRQPVRPKRGRAARRRGRACCFYVPAQ